MQANALLIGFAGLDVSFARALGVFVVWSGVMLLLLFVIFKPLWMLMSLPLRRQERAAILLDLLESGMKDGRSPGEMIQELGRMMDQSMGLPFRRLATQVQAGMRLSGALGTVPGVVPRQMRAMLEAGEETGELRRVIPVCRGCLRDGVPRVRSALNFIPVVLLYLIPVQLVVLWMIPIWIVPKLRAIAEDMGTVLPAYSEFVFESLLWMLPLVALLTLVLVLIVGSYVFGLLWKGPLPLSRILDRLAYRMPWRRKRLQRDFSAMLALMLDAGLTEERAVLMAARSTANSAVLGRAEQALAELREGAPLEKAMGRIDDGGEFRWRLANATHGATSVWSALAGWQDSLEAKAFQQEQAAAQIVAAFFVLGNGAVVGLVTTSLFWMLANLIAEVSLW